jgi:hypothetical protein
MYTTRDFCASVLLLGQQGIRALKKYQFQCRSSDRLA